MRCVCCLPSLAPFLTPFHTPHTRALLNESHSDIVIEVPVPKDESDAKGYHTADDLMNRLDARVHAVLKHS